MLIDWCLLSLSYLSISIYLTACVGDDSCECSSTGQEELSASEVQYVVLTVYAYFRKMVTIDRLLSCYIVSRTNILLCLTDGAGGVVMMMIISDDGDGGKGDDDNDDYYFYYYYC